MPFAKWYLIVNVQAFAAFYSAIACIVALPTMVLFVYRDDLNESTRKKLVIAIVVGAVISLAGLLICLLEAFTGRGWR